MSSTVSSINYFTTPSYDINWNTLQMHVNNLGLNSNYDLRSESELEKFAAITHLAEIHSFPEYDGFIDVPVMEVENIPAPVKFKGQRKLPVFKLHNKDIYNRFERRIDRVLTMHEENNKIDRALKKKRINIARRRVRRGINNFRSIYGLSSDQESGLFYQKMTDCDF